MASDMNKSRESWALIFQKYVDANYKLKNYMSNTRSYLVKLKAVELISPSLLDKEKALLSFGKKSNLAGKYSQIKLNIDDLISDIDKLLELIDRENNETSNLFKSVTVENIEAIKSFEQRCINYNRDERVLLNSIFTKAPGLKELENNIFGMTDELNGQVDKIFAESAGIFVNFFVEFYNLVKTKNKEAIFNGFVTLAFYLRQYQRTSSGLTQNWGSSFISACNDGAIAIPARNLGDAQNERADVIKTMNIFLHNFIDSSFALGTVVLSKLDSYNDKLEFGKDFKPTKMYSVANEEGKLDTDFKNFLEKCFRGASFGDIQIKSLVKEMFKTKSNFTELVSDFNELYSTLYRGKFAALKFQRNKNVDNLKIKCAGLSSAMTLKSFRDTYLKDDKPENIKVLENVNLYLETLIASKDNKEPFSGFKSLNNKVLEVSSSSSSDDEEDKFTGEKLAEHEINGAYVSLFNRIGKQVGLLEDILGSEDSYDEDKFKTEIRENIISILGDIKVSLNNVGKNLGAYRSKVKSNWNDGILESHKKDILHLIQLIDGDLSSSENLKNVISRINSLLSLLK